MNRTEQKFAVATVYVAAMFMAIMDTTIVNVALPTLARQFHTTADSVGLVSIGYLVSLAVFIPVSGWLGDRIGGRTALLAAVTVFTVASALCGIATSLPELVAFRILQGVGGAIMTPVGLAMLFRVYPPAERIRISSVLAMVTALAPALGPILGGVFTSYLSWRLVFFVNVPIGIATVVFGGLALESHRVEVPGRLDFLGLVLSGAGLGLAMYGVSEGPNRGWSSASVLIPGVTGVVLLILLVFAELRRRQPLVDLRLLSNRLFACATSLYGLASVAYLGALFLAALFFQEALGMSAIESGLATVPSAIGVMVGGQLVTRVLYRRFGPRRLVITGLVTITIALIAMASIPADAGLVDICSRMLVLGLGVAFVFVPSQAISMATITREQTGRASSIFNASKQIGGAVGVALVCAVPAAAGPTQVADGRTEARIAPFHWGFGAAAAVALCAVVVALAIHDADAAGTTGRTASTQRSCRAREARLKAERPHADCT